MAPPSLQPWGPTTGPSDHVQCAGEYCESADNASHAGARRMGRGERAPSRVATGGRGSRRSGRPRSGRRRGTGCCSPAARSSRSWPWCSRSCCAGRQRRLARQRRAAPPAAPAGQRSPRSSARSPRCPPPRSTRWAAAQATSAPTTITGAPLTSGGKPEMLYIGAEYCPYCAAERWAMIVALSRFGTFSGLRHDPLGGQDGAGQRRAVPEHRDLDVRERRATPAST